LETPKAESSFWFAALFRLRAEADIGSVLVMEVEAQLRVPIMRHTFVFERPQSFVYETPTLGAGILAGAAARIFQ
jgi:hypothetical protein